MNTLFKYLRKAHADALLSLGVTRIGTLGDFRRQEVYGDQVGDADEGMLAYDYAIPEEGITFSAETQPEFLKAAFKMPASGSAKFAGFTVRHHNTAADCYLFCMTDTVNPVQMRELGYDACVRIDNPPRFFAALSTVVPGRFVGVFRCKYAARVRDHSKWRKDSDHPGLVKDPRYSSQREVRAIWTAGSNAAIEPFTTIAMDIVGACSRVNI